MATIVALIIFGSGLLTLLLSWQVKHVSPDFGSVIRYNLLILPLLFAANVALGVAFIRANGVVKNLPLLVAAQSFIYYLFLLAFSVLLIGEKISIGRAVVGFGLMAVGVWVLKK